MLVEVSSRPITVALQSMVVEVGEFPPGWRDFGNDLFLLISCAWAGGLLFIGRGGEGTGGGSSPDMCGIG